MLKKLMIIVLLIIGCYVFIAKIHFSGYALTNIVDTFFNFTDIPQSPTTTVVPEPETYRMISFGLILMGAIAYRRRGIV